MDKMNRRRRQLGLRQSLRLVFFVALLLYPPVQTPTAPPEKPNEDKKSADAPREDEEPKTELILQGRFQKGILLGQQEEMNPLATFRADAPDLSPEDYQVSIDWGDQSEVSRGQIVSAGYGLHKVTGRHIYAATGRYPVKVSVTEPNGTTAVTRSIIEVGDIYAGSLDEWTVATIPAGDPKASDDLQTTLDWGDGSSAVAGSVRGEGGSFRISGRHAYPLDGPYTVSVLVTDDGAVKLSSKRAIRVVRPSVVLTVNRIPSSSLTNTEVASFRVPNLKATAREYAAVINWGDGTPIDADAVIVGSGGEFRILASHTYEPGLYRFSVLILQSWH